MYCKLSRRQAANLQILLFFCEGTIKRFGGLAKYNLGGQDCIE